MRGVNKDLPGSRFAVRRLLILVQALRLVAIALLACTMTGAVIVWIAVGQPFAALIPGTLLVVLPGVGFAEHTRREPE
jgi:hypothetical protein